MENDNKVNAFTLCKLILRLNVANDCVRVSVCVGSLKIEKKTNDFVEEREKPTKFLCLWNCNVASYGTYIN